MLTSASPAYVSRFGRSVYQQLLIKEIVAQLLKELLFKIRFDKIKQNSIQGSFKKKNNYYMVIYKVVIKMHKLRI